MCLALQCRHGIRLPMWAVPGQPHWPVLILQDAAERVHLLPAALRALSAVLLADHKVGRGQQQQQRSATHHLCAKLLAHPRADIFLDVVFDAVRTLYRMVSDPSPPPHHHPLRQPSLLPAY